MTRVPFFRPDLSELEIQEAMDTLRSGWLTTGPKARRFEQEFAEAVGARHAVAVNSCTAALHLAVEALGLKPRQGVLVPTLTFAATAEIVRYQGAVPILVDCDPSTLNMDLSDAGAKLARLRAGVPLAGVPRDVEPVGIIPVHVGGFMMPVSDVNEFASRHCLWVVEDAAHAFPAAWRPASGGPWQRCGENTADVTCFSFYANKTMTTGEGGMAVSDDAALAARMRQMSLHGLSQDAGSRYTGSERLQWDYAIEAPGFKYNLTDMAAALGLHQLARSEQMRRTRQAIAGEFLYRLADVEEIELPPNSEDRVHSWHLFPLKLRLDQLSIDRAEFIQQLFQLGVRCSVHWRPLHLHPYYQKTFGWRPDDLPIASATWLRLVSLPLFSSMRREEIDHVIETVRGLCSRHRHAFAGISSHPGAMNQASAGGAHA